MNDLVSVIMPCFNDGEYISESIASVYAQTYKPIELIIVDDGSDDSKTLQILEKIKQSSQCIVLHSSNKGPSAARNIGISHAKGKYIMPLDSDDTIDSTYIEKAVRAIEEKSDRGVVYCHADKFGIDSGPWQLPEYSLEQMLIDNVVFVTALFYRDDWEKVGGFNEKMIYGVEDYDFWISIMEIGKEIYQLPETLFHYRIKQKSRTTVFRDNKDSIKGMYRLIYENHPLFYEKYKDYYAIALRNGLIERDYTIRDLSKKLKYWRAIVNAPVLRYIFKLIKFVRKKIHETQ